MDLAVLLFLKSRTIHFPAILCFVVMLGCATPQSGLAEGSATHLGNSSGLKIDETIFQTVDPRKREALSEHWEEQLLENESPGLWIYGPSTSLKDLTNLSLVVAAVRDGKRDWSLPFRHNALLVTFQSVATEPVLSPLLPFRKRTPRFELQPELLGEETEALGVIVEWVDVTRYVTVTKPKGFLTFWVVYYDWLSNSVTFSLDGSEITQQPSPKGDFSISVNDNPYRLKILYQNQNHLTDRHFPTHVLLVEPNSTDSVLLKLNLENDVPLAINHSWYLTTPVPVSIRTRAYLIGGNLLLGPVPISHRSGTQRSLLPPP